MSRFALFAVSLALLAVPIAAAPVPKGPPPPNSWPMLGGTPARNMVNLRERLTAFPKEGPDWEKEDEVKKWHADWVLWKADLGSRAYGGPTVAGGKVYVGTNNERPRNARDIRIAKNGEVDPIDKGILMVFDEKTGKFLWQAVHDKQLIGGVSDWPKEGLCSAPAIVGDRVYYVSNQCRVVCADVNGLADGNQGIQTEKYKDDTDADIIWEYDMIKALDVFPHNMSNGCPLIVGDRLFVQTSNGVDENHINLPSPNAPSLICLDRNTGKLLWKDNSPGKDIMHGQWSSPTYAEEPVPQVLHGQGDGWLRAFDPTNGKLLWKFDCNRKGAKYDLGGTGDKSDFLATPVVHGGRVYLGTGQDPEHSSGIADLWCIDLKRAVEQGAKSPGGDVSPDLLVRMEKQPDGEEKAITKPNPHSSEVWRYGGTDERKWAPRDFKFGRTMSNVAVVDGLVYAAELHGFIYCLDAKTGKLFWQYDTRASIWGSPYFVDGKVLLATDGGDLFIFKHDPKPEVIDAIEAANGAPDKKTARAIQRAERARTEKTYLLAKIEFPASIRTTNPIVVNGVLFVTTESSLYALQKK